MRFITSYNHESLIPLAPHQIEWAILGKSDAIVGVSNSVVESLQARCSFPEKIHKIYNGLDESCYFEHTSDLPVSQKVTNILIASRLTKWKAIDIGLLAFLRLADEEDSLHLHVIGAGSELPYLQNIVQTYKMFDRVSFHGWVTNPKYWYLKSDCLLHPSPMEAFGRVIAEANSCGLPAIAPQLAGAGELIINKHTGLTFINNNVDGCHETLSYFIHLTYRERQIMSERAITRANQLFRATTIAKEYIGLANNLIQSI